MDYISYDYYVRQNFKSFDLTIFNHKDSLDNKLFIQYTYDEKLFFRIFPILKAIHFLPNLTTSCIKKILR